MFTGFAGRRSFIEWLSSLPFIEFREVNRKGGYAK